MPTPGYKYEPRAEMPFWYDFEPDKYQKELDLDSNLSIDDNYDPESAVKIEHFETISRLIDYKDNLIRFMKNSAFSFPDKMDLIKEM